MSRGRKSKYETHIQPFINVIKQMRIDGQTEEAIHNHLGVGHNAWNNYKNQHKELKEALKISKEILVADLEETLFQQAKKGNTTALIFALKNLAPKKWGEKIDVSGNVKMEEFNKSLGRMIEKL